MATTAGEAVAGAAEQVWFLDNLVTFHVPASSGTDGMSVLEHHGPHGASPPLHTHASEDEVFHVLEGELHFRIGTEDRTARAGDTLIATKGTAHTYGVESPQGARWLTVTCRGDFERFVRALGRPAEHAGLPPAGGPPTPEAREVLRATALQYGIELIGPPLH